jgi:hypothetical protein
VLQLGRQRPRALEQLFDLGGVVNKAIVVRHRADPTLRLGCRLVALRRVEPIRPAISQMRSNPKNQSVTCSVLAGMRVCAGSL